MFWKKSEKSAENNSKTIAKVDPRTKVNTTTAQSETTNTSVQNATLFNSNTNTVTFESTRQTVTHTQQARVTEILTRRTPTLEELEEMLRAMNMQKPESTQRRSGNFSGTTAQRRSGNFTTNASNGISSRSTTKFKSSADTTSSPVARLIFTFDATRPSTSNANGDISPKRPNTPKTPTLIKIQEITCSQKTGRTFTSHTETQRIKLKTRNINTPYKSDARPLLALPEPTVLSKSNTTYTSPYLNSAKYTAPYANWRNYAAKPTTTTTSASESKISQKPVYTANSFASLYKPKTTTILNFPNTSIQTTTTSPNTKSNTTTTNSSNKSNGKKSLLKPGHAYIFNNERFDDPKNETRIGSAEDVKMLCKTFEAFKLKVTVIENATLKKIKNCVEKIETKDFTQISSIVIVIMSHGTRYEEVAAKDGNYSIDDFILFPILRNRTLIDKPKLFFIQACKGAMESGGFKTDASLPHGTPSEILKCYSTFEGYVSYRSKEGSLFIQSLCETLQRFGSIKNIKEIMETITLLVKQQSGNRQIPTITSTLTKPYVFGDYV